MVDLKNVLIGWGTWLGMLAMSPETRRESERRLTICDGCEFAKPSVFLEFISDESSSVDSKYCTICKCPCHQKSVVDKEKCPKNKW